MKLNWFLSALIGLAGLAAQLVVVGDPPRVVVEFNAVEQAIKISSKVDFASVRVTFDDLPQGQYITVKELRDVIKARPK